MTELLIVIGLIVLVIALAVPAFKAMTGGRSVDAAQNQLAAVLGVARSEAIAQQRVRGVMFYLDPATERVDVALVQEAIYTPTGSGAPPVAPDLYLDLVPDRDPLALPVGVGLQGIDNCELTAGPPPARTDDGYVGFNLLPGGGPPPDRAVRYGGVILFDGNGRLINKTYGFYLGMPNPAGGPGIVPTRLAELLGFDPTGTPPRHFVAQQNVPGSPTLSGTPPMSLFGFLLYDAELFKTRAFTEDDPQMNTAAGAYAGGENVEERWLDENGTPVLINHYNGTLIRGE
jgi:type II secretory pathway pseudopilin PulG